MEPEVPAGSVDQVVSRALTSAQAELLTHVVRVDLALVSPTLGPVELVVEETMDVKSFLNWIRVSPRQRMRNPGMASSVIPGFRRVLLCGVVGGFQALLGFLYGHGHAAGIRSAQCDGGGHHQT